MAGKPLLGGNVKKNVEPQSSPKVQSPPPRLSLKGQKKAVKIATKQVEQVNKAAPTSKATKFAFKNPVLNSTIMAKPTNASQPVPRHDPDAPGALVMRRPTTAPKGKRIVDVVVDPFLGRHLREHQVEGVKFMYECVMGMRPHAGEGAILADDMGLGKTLQTITLLWTLLKQNPVYEEAPVVKKAIIVVPASLIHNWRKEFRKWLGNERIGVFVADGKNLRITDFTRGKAYNVMIIGYEKLRVVQEELNKGPGIDIIVVDEGHRLKTAQNKAAAAIKSLNCERRVVLTGTPLQNDLGEYFVTVDFVNPGLLGKYATFKKEFETPILKGRQPEATALQKEKGEEREQELMTLTGQFMLRRSSEILAKYLPPKTEYVIFCKPTAAQISVYKAIIGSPIFKSALGSNEMALQLISILKKVCNSPSLLKSKNDDERPPEVLENLFSSLPATMLAPSVSTKIRVLDSLLNRIRTTTQEKVVLVSNYTATLDILQRLLTSNSYTYLRLDGSTPVSKRQGIVDRFNNTSAAVSFAFLLSAKSGGVGLNLIGASRLVLFDIDWNPATDAQAMARIHRDGQKKPCRIYRLLVQGALDEKVYQRQITKQGLADAVVDNKASSAAFTAEELRDLFTLDEREHCQTHTLLSCDCGGTGDLAAEASDAVLTHNADTPRTGSVEPTSGGEDSDDDSSLPELPTVLLKASQVNMEEQERLIREKRQGRSSKGNAGKTKFKALMQYRHVDVKLLQDSGGINRDIEDVQDVEAALVEDEILMDVVKEEESRVCFLFAKTSG